MIPACSLGKKKKKGPVCQLLIVSKHEHEAFTLKSKFIHQKHIRATAFLCEICVFCKLGDLLIGLIPFLFVFVNRNHS